MELAIRNGRFLIYRLYDIANEIDLSKAETLVAAHTPISRLQLRRLRPKVVRFTTPPLTISVPLHQELRLTPNLPPVQRALVRLYDFGVAAVRLDVAIPPHTLVPALNDHLQDLFEAEDAVSALCRPLVRETMNGIASALYKPQWEQDQWEEEDYLIVYVQTFEGDSPVSADEVLNRVDFARLLMAEDFPLSQQVKEDVLQYMYTYSAGDLAVISWETAFVYDTEGIMDVPDLLEFATAQLLELVFFDTILAEELDAAYDDVEALQQTARGVLRYRHLRRILNRLLRTIMEMTEVSDRVINALRLTEDVFYARVYTGATEVFGLPAWMNGVQEKLHNLREIYTLLAEEAADTRLTLLEASIVVLIVLEILLFSIKG